jgi:hypothetical protein
MRTTEGSLAISGPGFRLVGHPGEVAPVNGAYRCLCCGTVLWRVRRGRRFPECPTHNCPTMWLWLWYPNHS